MSVTRVILGFTQSDRENGYASFSDGFRPDAEQTVAVLKLPEDAPTVSHRAWAEAFFVAMNSPDDGYIYEDTLIQIARQVLASYGQPLRSLSVGDTVTVQGRTVACASAGWDEVDHMPQVPCPRCGAYRWHKPLPDGQFCPLA